MSDWISKILKQAGDSEKTLQSISLENLTESQAASVKFWKKIIKNCYAITELIEKKFYDEVFVVYRLCLEHAFNMSALLNKEDFIVQLKNNTDVALPKSLIELNKSVLKKDNDHLPIELRKCVDLRLKEYEENPISHLGYSIYNAAMLSEIGSLYNSIYRTTSLSYAHSTYLSIAIDDSESEMNEVLENVYDFLRIADCLIKVKLVK